MDRPLIRWDTGEGVVKIYDTPSGLSYEIEDCKKSGQRYHEIMSAMLPRFGHILKKRVNKDFPAPGVHIEDFSNAVRRSFASDIEMNAFAYTYRWIKKADAQTEAGIYDKIAELAGIRDGDVWLDVGCGDGRLMSAVLMRSKPIAFGMDSNEYMLDAARERLESGGREVSTNARYEIVQDKEFGWKLRYSREPDFRAGKVNLILDDMRDMETVKASLPGPLDRITYTFPGGMRAIANYEIAALSAYASYPLLLQDAVHERVMLNANKLLKPAGEMIVVVPAPADPCGDFSDHGLELIGHEEFPVCLNFTDNGALFYHDLPEGSTLHPHLMRLRKR